MIVISSFTHFLNKILDTEKECKKCGMDTCGTLNSQNANFLEQKPMKSQNLEKLIHDQFEKD
jgi:hypothetical protein